MTHYRISEAATLLGVSDDTVRRWVRDANLPVTKDEAGKQIVRGTDLAEHAKRFASAPDDTTGVLRSARNRMTGLVTGLISDTVMSQVEMICGPFRVVSLMSTEGVNEMGLEVGSRVVAVVKATMVIVEAAAE